MSAKATVRMNRLRTALVTGASRGLGAETCRQLTKRGFRVLATSRTTEAAKGRDHRKLDVEDASSVAALTRELRAEGIGIDVLVNNAGMTMKGFNVEVARRTLDVNFFGALRVTDALLPLIPDGGGIVMVSSGMGELSCVGPELRERLLDPGLTREALAALMHSFVDSVGAPGGEQHTKAGWPSSAYRVSKVGLNALVRVLARELEARRIRVNAVCPGWVRTDMGGPGADRDVTEGAASIVWAAALEDGGPTGGFFRDGHAIDW